MRVVDLLCSMPGRRQGAGPPADGADRHRREPPRPWSRHQAGRRARARVRPGRVSLTAARTRGRPGSPSWPGPRRSARGSVSADIRAHHPEIWISVSATTRAPAARRAATASTTGSSPRRSSTAWSREDELLEWAVVHGAARYGTPARPGRGRRWRPGRPALLEIDLQGARQVRERMPEALFVLPGAALLGGAGPPAGRPRHRDRGRAGAPPGHRAGGAGRRAGVRRGHREPRNSRCRRGVGSLDDRASRPYHTPDDL